MNRCEYQSGIGGKPRKEKAVKTKKPKDEKMKNDSGAAIKQHQNGI